MEAEDWEILLTHTKNHYSYPILDNGISSFRNSYSNNGYLLDDQHYLSESSQYSTDTSYLQNQGSHLNTIIERKEKNNSNTIYQKNTYCR